MNVFSNETYLNVKHQPFIFKHIVQIYLNTYWYTLARPYERSVAETHRPGLFHQQRFLVHKQTSYTKHVLLVL